MNILLAVDNSSYSEAASKFLQEIQFHEASQLVVLSIFEPSPWQHPLRTKEYPDIQEQHSMSQSQKSSEVWGWFNSLAESCKKPKMTVLPLLKEGIPGRQILHVIEEYDIDLVVVGTHGRSGLKSLFLGSVSEWVLTEAPCSVLVVREPLGNQPKGLRKFRALIGVDGSPDSLAAIQFVQQLGLPAPSGLTVCHVLEEKKLVKLKLEGKPGMAGFSKTNKVKTKISKAQDLVGENLLNEFERKIKTRSLKVERKLVCGHAAEQVLSLAKRQNVDLIVVGSRGVTGLRKFFLGSVSNKVACHAPCSVLVVRKPRSPKMRSKSSKVA
jgi:nucleotide-binding universal stress UspA family protein